MYAIYHSCGEPLVLLDKLPEHGKPISPEDMIALPGRARYAASLVPSGTQHGYSVGSWIASFPRCPKCARIGWLDDQLLRYWFTHQDIRPFNRLRGEAIRAQGIRALRR